MLRIQVVYFDEDKISEIVGLSNDSLTEDLLPPADYYIEKSEAESNTVVHDSLPDVAELYIKNQKGKKQPSFSATGRISDAFANFYNSIRKKLDIKSSQYLSPIDARQGSFIIRLKSPNINECMPYIKNVFRILNESELPYQELTELGIDLKSHKLNFNEIKYPWLDSEAIRQRFAEQWEDYGVDGIPGDPWIDMPGDGQFNLGESLTPGGGFLDCGLDGQCQLNLGQPNPNWPGYADEGRYPAPGHP